MDNSLEKRLRNYSKAILKFGVNLQNGQKLTVNASVDHKDFVRLFVEEAYDFGASEVLVVWGDSYVQRQKLLKAPEEVITNIYNWEVEMPKSFLNAGAATISLVGSYGDLLSDVPSSRIGAYTKARQLAFKDVMELTMMNKNRWCVAGVPNPEWAQKVYNTTDVDQLWKDILYMARIDEDGYDSLIKHVENLKVRKEFLNRAHFDAIRYEGPGTELTVQLPSKHLWISGMENDVNGIPFLPNIPTEEVFTAPYKYGINGRVSSSMPLVYQGNIIDEFWLEFKDGKVADFDAKTGKNILKELIDTDEGASYIGEVALVDITSPIYKLGKIFYNTLYDENAASHFALGRAYPTCIEDFDGDVEKAGINMSLTHVDFMVGNAHMNVYGIKNGEETLIMENGLWKI
ncbi:MAG TPA: aminopeptidase [Fervidobacterium sp.]|nr:aminopeptidase [Fervidobacterium sp.]MBP9518184.1 aminopeptidase [Fervidobacterium sp.]HCL98831.1 aminopeptidase [Fervidobacterium sp.]HOK33223.1 aminopeptidase [Fervidobacterium sp.]HOL03088.1 aminopeptidase [Fervidobacterium sp.]